MVVLLFSVRSQGIEIVFSSHCVRETTAATEYVPGTTECSSRRCVRPTSRAVGEAVCLVQVQVHAHSSNRTRPLSTFRLCSLLRKAQGCAAYDVPLGCPLTQLSFLRLASLSHWKASPTTLLLWNFWLGRRCVCGRTLD
jgi:hypothetical protein